MKITTLTNETRISTKRKPRHLDRFNLFEFQSRKTDREFQRSHV